MSVTCSVCEIVCDNEFQLRQHETGRKHRTNCLKFQGSGNIDFLKTSATISLPRQVTPTKPVSLSPNRKPDTFGCTVAVNQRDLYCHLCCIQLNSAEQLEAHFIGQKHRKKSSKSNASVPVLSHTVVGNQIECNFRDSAPEHLMNQSIVANYSTEYSSLPQRKFTRSCREYLEPIWPDVTFTLGEADTLVVAAELKDDCVLLLDDIANAWFRVGIHLMTGLLTANQDPSYSCTSAIWISPTIHAGPDPHLLSSFRFPPTIKRSKRCLKLLCTLPPFEKSFSDFDIFLTNPDNFCQSLATILFQQEKICCLILQQADQLAQNSKLNDILRCYMEQFPDASRARILCLADTHMPSGSLFEKFKQIYFAPVTSCYHTG